jgi:Carboxypeptidase regulatory-like domain
MRRAGRALAAMTAAVVLAAGCSSKTFDQVKGTVLDARTGKPVAQAKVTATAPNTAAVTGPTDAQGTFTLRKVSKQAHLAVTATNYEAAADVPVSGKPLNLTLRPIPVQGMITSTLTNKGLQASLDGKLHERTAADGTFRVYGVGPGDRLSVAAPGYKTASMAIDQDRRVHVLLVAEEATRIQQVNQWLRAGNLAPVWRYVFLTPKGYGYEESPPELKAEARKQFAAAGQAVKGFDMRSVTKGGTAANMAVLVVALDPRVAAAPGANEGFLTGVSQSAGAKPQPITLAGGNQVAYIDPPSGPKAILLSEGSLQVMILGDAAERLKGFASAFINAHE